MGYFTTYMDVHVNKSFLKKLTVD